MSERDREKSADIALWDFGSREGATAKRVMEQMKEAGFSQGEVLAAVKRMSGSEGRG